MKVFVSWSGDRSRAAAMALHDWMPDIIQSVQPWTSSLDISAGARWNQDINLQLSETKFGVLCLTRENLDANWILFEAGALAKTVNDTFVVPYLIDVEPSDLAGPLAQFQAQRCTKEGTWRLVRSLNSALDKGSLPEDRLKRVFERSWPELKSSLDSIPESEVTPKAPRSSEDILREVLELVRGISKRSTDLLTRRDLISIFSPSQRLHPSVNTYPSIYPRSSQYPEQDVNIADAEMEAAREEALVQDAIDRAEARQEAALQAALDTRQAEEDRIEAAIEEQEAREAKSDY